MRWIAIVLAFLSIVSAQSKKQRIAIILTGQFRSANLSWSSRHVTPSNAMSQVQLPVATNNNRSVAITIIHNLFLPLLNYGFAIDVFIYLPTQSNDKRYKWDGRPERFQLVAGDTTACEIYHYSNIFSSVTNQSNEVLDSNHLFCRVEKEKDLISPFIAKYPEWKDYFLYLLHGPSWEDENKQRLIAQMHDIYEANLAAKQFARLFEFQYDYKIRLRPDLAIAKPVPDLSQLTFQSIHAHCSCAIYSFDRLFWGMSESSNYYYDAFAAGRATAMDSYLDRYLDFIGGNRFFANRQVFKELNMSAWISEDHLESIVFREQQACIEPLEAFKVFLVRANGHSYFKSWRPQPLADGWKLINK